MATHEQLVLLVRELEESVRDLEEQNALLRAAAADFGALAERLNGRITADRRRASAQMWSSMRIWAALNGFATRTPAGIALTGVQKRTARRRMAG